MKLLVVLSLVAFCAANEETDAIKLASDNPQKLQALFSQFRKDNHRTYQNAVEARMRMSTFRNFVKEAAKVNEEQEDITVGVTFFADMTEEEKVQYHGANVTEEVGEDVEQWVASEVVGSDTVSHRSKYGAIKHQGRCGSCWAFGAVGVTEGFQSMTVGQYTALSEQQVLDCSRAGSCAGGYHSRALSYIRNTNKLAGGSQYSYKGRQQRCSAGNYQSAMQIRVTRIWQARGDRNLASAIARGPVAVLLYNFHGVAVEGYKAGVLRPENHGPRSMNHIVVAVGYTPTYWELRNSWGTNWGEQGYFKHDRRRNNNIGVSDHAFTMDVSRAVQEEEE